MDITLFIRDLILSNESVILRGFGGFETTYRNATLDKNKKLIAPPGKKITFRPDWTKDNGILENYIANSLNITPDKASKYISLFVYDLLTRIENEGGIQLEGIGKFKKNKSRVLEFYQIEDETYLADSFGLDTLDIEAVPAAKVTSSETEFRPMLPQRRNKTGRFVITGLLLLSIIITTLIVFSGKEGIPIFNYSKKIDKKTTKSDEIIFGKKSDALQDSVTRTIEQTLDKNTSPKKALSPNSQTQVAKTKETGKITEHLYFLVAGSFKSSKNAEILKKKLANKGFKSEILNTGGNMVKVIVGRFDNRNDAVTELQRIRGQINQSVWLMEK